ncbi:hypothetical protein KI387_039355, partial [Taxus chinensis]
MLIYDYGLKRDVGSSHHYKSETHELQIPSSGEGTNEIELSWTLFDDLYFNMEYQPEYGFYEKPSEEIVWEVNVVEKEIGESGQGVMEEMCELELYPHEGSVGAVNFGTGPGESPTENTCIVQINSRSLIWARVWKGMMKWNTDRMSEGTQ